MRLRRALRTRPLQITASIALLGATAASLCAAPGLEGLLGGYLAALMLAIALIDARYFLIPNELTLAAGALALVRAGLAGSDPGAFAVLAALFRAAATALPLLFLLWAYRRWRGRDGLGLGDVKLAAVAGAWLDWTMVFLAIEMATLAALAAYAIAGLIRRRSMQRTALLPFGLFLAPAIWIGWLAESMLRWI